MTIPVANKVSFDDDHEPQTDQTPPEFAEWGPGHVIELRQPQDRYRAFLESVVQLDFDAGDTSW